jgi:H+/gluconate symporter-like permease
MRDTKLIVLVLLATVLSLAHTADHAARGDVRWPLDTESAVFILVSAAIYTVLGCGLYLYRQGWVGPRYWAIVAGIGVAVGWLGHFSPFTDQPPQHILNAYRSAALGWLALGCLVALMLVLIIGVIYAAYLCGRASRQST